MAAVSIRLPEDIAQRLNQLATLTGRSKSFYITEAILEHLDDLVPERKSINHKNINML